MSADPAGFALINPNRAGYSVIEATNWYAYVSNNPVKYVDPTGMREVGDATIPRSTPYWLGGSYPGIPPGHSVAPDTKGNLIRGRDYNPESTVIDVDRPTDGYGNSFSSKVSATTTMKNGQKLSDPLGKVGANAESKKFANDNEGRTLPDGDYSLKTEGGDVFPNAEGGSDSPSYHNVLKIETDDPNIPEPIRKSINSGMYLIHGTENKNTGDTWDHPWSAGCVSPPGNQPGQDRFMKSINDLPKPLGNITFRIQSRIKVKRGVE